MIDVEGTITQKLAVVIPAFNEASTIASVVQQAKQLAFTIVVDDGSTDETADLARKHAALVVSHPTNRGYDTSLETGLCFAHNLGFSYVVTIDADGQHSPLLLQEFYTAFESGADLIVGYRNHCQRWSEVVFCFFGELVWGIRDPLCGMKGYRLNLLSKIGKFNTYESIGTELALRLVSDGIRLHQVKIETLQRIGKSRFGDGLRANLRIMKALWTGFARSKIFRSRSN